MVVVVEGVTGGRPRAMVAQGADNRGRWMLKLLRGTGPHAGRNLGDQEHGVTVLVDGEPWIVTGHNANHLHVEPVEAGYIRPTLQSRSNSKRVRVRVEEP